MQQIHLLLCTERRRGSEEKAPKVLQVKDSNLDSNGNFIQNSDGSFQCEEVLTRWTCHAAAHQEGLRSYLIKRRNELISTAKGIPPGAEGGGERSGEGGDESERVAIQSASAAVPVSIKKRRTR